VIKDLLVEVLWC